MRVDNEVTNTKRTVINGGHKSEAVSTHSGLGIALAPSTQWLLHATLRTHKIRLSQLGGDTVCDVMMLEVDRRECGGHSVSRRIERPAAKCDTSRAHDIIVMIFCLPKCK